MSWISICRRVTIVIDNTNRSGKNSAWIWMNKAAARSEKCWMCDIGDGIEILEVNRNNVSRLTVTA